MDLIDGSSTDLATLGVAFLYSLLRLIRRRSKVESFISDLSYGLSIYPMILLSLVAFSSWAMIELQKSNKVLMSLAGLMSLVVIIRRSFEVQEPKKRYDSL